MKKNKHPLYTTNNHCGVIFGGFVSDVSSFFEFELEFSTLQYSKYNC